MATENEIDTTQEQKLLLTNTDSLYYEIMTPDIYKDMTSNSHYFDMSDYPQDHPLYSAINKKVLGKMKDECAGIPPSEFVGLRSRMYSILYDGKDQKTAKGISRSVVEKNLS